MYFFFFNRPVKKTRRVIDIRPDWYETRILHTRARSRAHSHTFLLARERSRPRVNVKVYIQANAAGNEIFSATTVFSARRTYYDDDDDDDAYVRRLYIVSGFFLAKCAAIAKIAFPSPVVLVTLYVRIYTRAQ